MTEEQLLAVAGEAADAAAEVLLSFSGRARQLDPKSSPTDLVSEADLEAEAAIRRVLAARVPDDAIVGEEGDDVPGTTGRRWVVDPLDGTVNFLFGVPHWCVSVACEDVCGVVLDPVRGERFAATASGPALLDGEALAPPKRTDDLALALVATGFGYEAQVRERQARLLNRLLPRVRDIRRAGSAALDLAWLAAGRYDLYYEFGVQTWDTAAGELLCRRAGLEVHPLPADGTLPPGVLAGPPGLAGKLLDVLTV